MTYLKYQPIERGLWAVARDRVKIGEIAVYSDRTARFIPIEGHAYDQAEMSSITRFMLTASGRVNLSEASPEDDMEFARR